MSLSVSPVRFSFGSNAAAAPQVNAEDLLGRQGAFANPIANDDVQAEVVSEPKEHKGLKTAIGTVVGLAVIAFGLFAAHKWGSKTFDATKEFADFKEEKFFKKAKGYITTAIGKAGKKIADVCTSIKKSVTGLFSKKAKDTNAAADAPKAAADAPRAAEGAAEGAAKA